MRVLESPTMAGMAITLVIEYVLGKIVAPNEMKGPTL